MLIEKVKAIGTNLNDFQIMPIELAVAILFIITLPALLNIQQISSMKLIIMSRVCFIITLIIIAVSTGLIMPELSKKYLIFGFYIAFQITFFLSSILFLFMG